MKEKVDQEELLRIFPGKLRKRIEEIEADIVHYQEKNIFFYVYDKKKIIKETKNFNDYFNKQFDRKTVKPFVLQPVKL